MLEVSNVCLGVLGTFSFAIFVMGLLTYRTNAAGMLIGLLAGVPVAIYLTFFRYLLVPANERIGFMYLGLITLFTILPVAYLASWITGRGKAPHSEYVIWSRYRFPVSSNTPAAETVTTPSTN